MRSIALIALIILLSNSIILWKVNLTRLLEIVDISCDVNSEYPDGVDDVLLLSYTHVMFVIVSNRDTRSCYFLMSVKWSLNTIDSLLSFFIYSDVLSMLLQV